MREERVTEQHVAMVAWSLLLGAKEKSGSAYLKLLAWVVWVV